MLATSTNKDNVVRKNAVFYCLKSFLIIYLLIISSGSAANQFKLITSHWHHLYADSSKGPIHSKLERDVYSSNTVTKALVRSRKADLITASVSPMEGEIRELYELRWSGKSTLDSNVVELILCSNSNVHSVHGESIRVNEFEGDTESRHCLKITLFPDAGKASLVLAGFETARIGLLDHDDKVYWLDEPPTSVDDRVEAFKAFQGASLFKHLSIKYDRWLSKRDDDQPMMGNGRPASGHVSLGSGNFGSGSDDDKKPPRSVTPASLVSTITVWFHKFIDADNPDAGAHMLSSSLSENSRRIFRTQVVTEDGDVLVADMNENDLDMAMRVAASNPPDFWLSLLNGSMSIEDVQAIYMDWMFHHGGESILEEESEARIETLVQELTGGYLTIRIPDKLVSALAGVQPVEEIPIPDKLVSALSGVRPVGDPDSEFNEPADQMRSRAGRGGRGHYYGNQAGSNSHGHGAYRPSQGQRIPIGGGRQGEDGGRPPASGMPRAIDDPSAGSINDYSLATIATELRRFQELDYALASNEVQQFMGRHFGAHILRQMTQVLRKLFENENLKNLIPKKQNIKKDTAKYYFLNLLKAGRAVQITEVLASHFNPGALKAQSVGTDSPEAPIQGLQVEGIDDHELVTSLEAYLTADFWRQLRSTSAAGSNENNVVSIDYITSNSFGSFGRTRLLDSTDSAIEGVIASNRLWDGLVQSGITLLNFNGPLLKVISGIRHESGINLLLQRMHSAGLFSELCGFSCEPVLSLDRHQAVAIRIQKNWDGTVQVTIDLNFTTIAVGQGKTKLEMPVGMALAVDLFFNPESGGQGYQLAGQKVRVVQSPDQASLQSFKQLIELQKFVTKIQEQSQGIANRQQVFQGLTGEGTYRSDYSALSAEKKSRERLDNQAFKIMQSMVTAKYKELTALIGTILENQAYVLTDGDDRYVADFRHLLLDTYNVIDRLESTRRYHQEVEGATYRDFNRNLIRSNGEITVVTWPIFQLRNNIHKLRSNVQYYLNRLKGRQSWTRRDLEEQYSTSRNFLLEVRRLQSEYSRIFSLISTSNFSEKEGLNALIRPLDMELDFSEMIARTWHLQVLHQTYAERRALHDRLLEKGITYLRVTSHSETANNVMNASPHAIPGPVSRPQRSDSYGSFVHISPPYSLTQPEVGHTSVEPGSGMRNRDRTLSLEDFLDECGQPTSRPVGIPSESRATTAVPDNSMPTAVISRAEAYSGNQASAGQYFTSSAPPGYREVTEKEATGHQRNRDPQTTRTKPVIRKQAWSAPAYSRNAHFMSWSKVTEGSSRSDYPGHSRSMVEGQSSHPFWSMSLSQHAHEGRPPLHTPSSYQGYGSSQPLQEESTAARKRPYSAGPFSGQRLRSAVTTANLDQTSIGASSFRRGAAVMSRNGDRASSNPELRVSAAVIRKKLTEVLKKIKKGGASSSGDVAALYKYLVTDRSGSVTRLAVIFKLGGLGLEDTQRGCKAFLQLAMVSTQSDFVAHILFSENEAALRNWYDDVVVTSVML